MSAVSIIIPAYNEEGGIEKVVKEVKSFAPKAEIIVVDDGSKDRTYELAKSLGVHVIKHEINKGKANALRTGYAAAKGDIIVTIDADCSYPPKEIPKLLSRIEAGADIVVGSRFLVSEEKQKSFFNFRTPNGFEWYRAWANIIGAKVASLILAYHLTDVTTGLRAFKKEISGLKVYANGLDYEAELTAKAITMGYKYYEVPIEFSERVGVSKLKFFRSIVKFFLAILRGKFKK